MTIEGNGFGAAMSQAGAAQVASDLGQGGVGVVPLAVQHSFALDADSEKRLHDLLNLLPAAVYTTDAAGRITFYNETAAALWGRRPTLNVDRWCGSWRMYWPDGMPLPHDQCPMAVVLKEGRAVSGQEAVVERPTARACRSWRSHRHYAIPPARSWAR